MRELGALVRFAYCCPTLTKNAAAVTSHTFHPTLSVAMVLHAAGPTFHGAVEKRET